MKLRTCLALYGFSHSPSRPVIAKNTPSDVRAGLSVPQHSTQLSVT